MPRSRREYVTEGLRSRAAQLWFGVGAAFPRAVEISEAGRTHRFFCHNWEEYVRARSLTYKEPGTYRWLDAELTLGDVFHDVGANIGAYTLPAAARVGPEGGVVAFEPHVANAASLLRNVSASGYEDRVTVISAALDSREGFFPFRYSDWEPGAAMSQLDASRDAFGNALEHVAVELKHATTVDALVAAGAIPAATHVKIDVDGNELRVLEGMRAMLESRAGPRSLQVEVNLEGRDDLLSFMAEVGYELAERHFSEGVDRLIAGGMSFDDAPFNAIFRPGAGRGTS